MATFDPNWRPAYLAPGEILLAVVDGQHQATNWFTSHTIKPSYNGPDISGKIVTAKAVNSFHRKGTGGTEQWCIIGKLVEVTQE